MIGGMGTAARGNWLSKNLRNCSTMNIHDYFKGKRILITGASGFIGGHVAHALSQVACHLELVDTNPVISNSSPRVLAAVTSHSVSIFDPHFLDLISKSHFDYIFHFAGNANVATSVRDPAFDFELNLRASLAMLETLRSSRSQSIILYASSAAVYGNPVRLPIREEDATVPISPYGVGKLSLERYLAVYCKLYGLRGVSVRMFSPFGPRLQKQIVFELIKQLATDPTRLNVLGDGTESRDFIYIDDLVSALLAVAAHGELDGTTYNIGRGLQTPVSDIVNCLVNLMGTHTAVIYKRTPMLGYPIHWCADITKLKALGWDFTVPLEAGLRQTAEWAVRENT